MAERKNGLAPVPAGLFRPTAGTTAAAPVDETAEPAEEQGRGETSAEPRPVTTRVRRKRAPVGGETKGRKLSLPDGVFDRLQLLAIRRRTTISAVAADILDKNLPRLRIEQD